MSVGYNIYHATDGGETVCAAGSEQECRPADSLSLRSESAEIVLYFSLIENVEEVDEVSMIATNCIA